MTEGSAAPQSVSSGHGLPTHPPVGSLKATRPVDLVMQGGVTSGVVYPPAIAEISRHFRLCGVGGASAGAIAAAVAAAAEHQRTHLGSPAGFQRVEGLGEKLGKPGFMSSLFEPDEESRPLFEIFGSASHSILAIPCALVRAHPVAFLWTLFPLIATATVAWLAPPDFLTPQMALSLWIALGLWGSLAIGLLATLIALAWCLWCDLANLRHNDFGLCSGHGGSGKAPGRLTDWLSTELDITAGLHGAGTSPTRPLTFGDLWGPPKEKEAREAEARAAGAKVRVRPPQPGDRDIDLRVVTSNLTWGCPHQIPFSRNDFHFSPAEMRALFPEYVVRWMEEHPRTGATPVVSDDDRPLLALPSPRDCPVIVAVRMSLSFPFLFRAVPLWAVPWELAEANQPPPRARRCLFSDGGLTANFPIRFFDELVPRWPTLGLSLRTFGEGELEERGIGNGPQQRVWMTSPTQPATNPRWYGLTQGGNTPTFGRLMGLLIATMKDWHDNSYFPLPGYRDRLAEVRLGPKEGGLNLSMAPATIKKLVEYGHHAGEVLSQRPLSTHQKFGWTAHQIERASSSLVALHEQLEEATRAAADRTFNAESLEDVLKDAASGVPVPGLPTTTNPAALLKALRRLRLCAKRWDEGPHPVQRPLRPRPEVALEAPL